MIPRSAVRYGLHPHGTGWSNVVHRATGIVLGTVVRWPDGAWIVYLPFMDEACGTDSGTREEAAALLLHCSLHEPPGFEKRNGDTVPSVYVRDATEAEARRLAPEAWKHWDLVGPLFAQEPG